jgi:hypothetical protein
MKKKNLQDERIVAQRHKIQSDAFGIIFFVLLISILVQQMLLDAPFEQYAVELICFLGMSVYLIIRNIALGNNLFGDGERAKIMLLVNSLVTGVIATTIHGVLNYTRYAEHYDGRIGFFIATSAIFFISITALTFIALLCLGILNKRKQANIQKQLDEKEQSE